MINQNLQMNKFKDLLKSMSRRLDRIERYANSAVTQTWDVADGFEWVMTTPATFGNSTVECTYTRLNKQFDLTFLVVLGSTYVNGAGSLRIRLPFPMYPFSAFYGTLVGSWTAYDYSGGVRNSGAIFNENSDRTLASFWSFTTGYVSGTSPWTWASSDYISGKISTQIETGF